MPFPFDEPAITLNVRILIKPDDGEEHSRAASALRSLAQMVECGYFETEFCDEFVSVKSVTDEEIR